MITTEKRFEADIESFFLSPAGGYTKGADTYDAKQGLYVNTLIGFVQRTQPKEWARFENANQVDPVRKFCTAFNTACLRDGGTALCPAPRLQAPWTAFSGVLF